MKFNKKRRKFNQINPLIVTKSGRVLCLDPKMVIDDNQFMKTKF